MRFQAQVLRGQFLTALGRPVHIVNLDPAVSNPPYPCIISITDLITLDSVMDEFGLGPNGAILYCVEYLEANFDWLVEKLDDVLEREDGDGYIIFDTPGQVELWTNHNSLKRIVERLTRMDYRVCRNASYASLHLADTHQLAAVHLSDAHYITDASKFIAVVLLALRAMMQLEMPHVNVLSKIDLLSTYGEPRGSKLLGRGLTDNTVSLRLAILHRVQGPIVPPRAPRKRAASWQVWRVESGDGRACP